MDRVVVRFNYLGAARHVPRTAVPSLAIDGRVRGPLAALLATVMFTGAATSVQVARLHAAQAAYGRAAQRLSLTAPVVAETLALQAQVLRDERIRSDVAELQRAGLSHADEMAWIGNRLPAQTWLRALRYENGVYSLEGASARAAAIGAAMLTLRDANRATVPQLVSLRDDGTTSAAPVRYTLRIVTRR